MKKLALLGLVVGGMALISSCKKDYICTISGTDGQFPGLKKSEAEAAKTSCEAIGGKWAVK